jgi:hypothetical protein
VADWLAYSTVTFPQFVRKQTFVFRNFIPHISPWLHFASDVIKELSDEIQCEELADTQVPNRTSPPCYGFERSSRKLVRISVTPKESSLLLTSKPPFLIVIVIVIMIIVLVVS